MNNPTERRKKYFKPIGTSSDEEQLSISKEMADEIYKLSETNTFLNTHRNKRSFPLIKSMDYEYESEVINFKKISNPEIKDSSIKLKNDLLVTTLDAPQGAAFGPDTPMGNLSISSSSDSPGNLFTCFVN